MMAWIIFVLLFLTCYEACVIVPQPVILFPLNAEYQTRDIKNRTAPGIPSAVSLAPGPYGEEDGSYEFFGNANSFIEFPNSPGGALDVQYSMTILCWVYYDEKGAPDGPIFNYNTGGIYGVHLWVVTGLFFARFNDRTFFSVPFLHHTSLAGGWKFVGASYDNETGETKLWADGAWKQTSNVGAGVELGTQGSVRMGVRKNGKRYFKGKISQLQIYNEALSQQQILKLETKPKEPCRHLEFIPDNIFQGYSLKNHVIRTIESINEDFCGALCFMEYNCVSFNVKVTGRPGTSTICELNNSTHHANLGDLQTLENSIYHGITVNPCDESLCQHSSTCQAGFTDKGYRCFCSSGFCGEHCETDIDECYAGNECSANALCHNLHGSYNCTCKEGYYGDGKNCRAANSCKKIKAILGEEAITGIYFLIQDGVKFEVYCHIESEDQVWTLIARSSNNDFLNWMRRRGQWWFTVETSVGQTANTSANSDLMSPAFWLVSGHEFKITRSDDTQHTALLRTSGDCLGGQTFRAKITSYGQFTNRESWEMQPNVDECRGSCNVSYAGRFEDTVGFKQAKCNGKIQGADRIGFWCAVESSGSVMMIGGGGQPCTLGDHGIGITRTRDRSFDYMPSTKRNDFGDVATSSPETSYSLNLWIQ